MTETKTPETFVTGETVSYYHGEYRMDVKVVAVDGDRVTVAVYGDLVTFTPRPSDGMFVKLGSPDHEVLPTMIYHREVPAPKKANAVATFFSRFFG